METDLGQFRATHKAWVSARGEFDAEMAKIGDGEKPDPQRNAYLLAELERTFNAFMEAARPIIRWNKT
jgi:hypothetical protein